jgi:hypothetical protein
MSLRHPRRPATGVAPRTSAATPAAPDTHARTPDSLDRWLSRDWSDAIHLGSLEDFQQIHVCTRNSLYEIVVVNSSGEVRVRGGRYFPDWTAARFAGCTAGGSLLIRHALALGLQMEIEVDCRRIVTSPVRTIALLQGCIPSA